MNPIMVLAVVHVLLLYKFLTWVLFLCTISSKIYIHVPVYKYKDKLI